MKFLTRKGYLIEEQGMTYLADTDLDLALGRLRAGQKARHRDVACLTRRGRKVLRLAFRAPVNANTPSADHGDTPLPWRLPA